MVLPPQTTDRISDGEEAQIRTDIEQNLGQHAIQETNPRAHTDIRTGEQNLHYEKIDVSCLDEDDGDGDGNDEGI